MEELKAVKAGVGDVHTTVKSIVTTGIYIHPMNVRIAMVQGIHMMDFGAKNVMEQERNFEL